MSTANPPDVAADEGRPIGYDLDGQPLYTMDQLLDAFAVPGYEQRRRVGWCPVGRRRDGYVVSTVFLVHDMSCGAAPRPLLYETMLLRRGGPVEGAPMARYCTRAEAETGHAEYVAAAPLLLSLIKRYRIVTPLEQLLLRPVRRARCRRVQTAMRHVARRRRRRAARARRGGSCPVPVTR